MKSSAVGFALVAAGILVASSPVFTHHSNALVDKEKLYTLPGEVTRFAFVNPHVAIYWKGPDTKGNIVEWYASSATPRSYAALGWTNKTFKPGERILVQGHPMRDGTLLMQFQALYHCATGEAVPTDVGNLDEYRTRVKIVPLNAERVKALCAEGKLIEGVLNEDGRLIAAR